MTDAKARRADVATSGDWTCPVGKKGQLKDVPQGCKMVKTILLAGRKRELGLKALWVS